jgi:dynein heavy chain
MGQKLFMNCGVEQLPTVFLLNDTQIIMESFLEDVNNILNNGQIPNLYSTNDEIQNMFESIKDFNKNEPEFKALTNDAEVWQFFLRKAKENIHVVLAMSPIGEDFKRRLRMFPSLVNCCAIDWFLPWP